MPYNYYTYIGMKELLKMTTIHRILQKCALSLMALLLLTGCSNDDTEYEYIDNSPLAIILYEPQSLGDLSFNDMIYHGMVSASKKYGIRVQTLEPSTYEEGIEYLKQPFHVSLNDGVKRIYIVASKIYKDFIEENADRIPDDENNQLLLLESREMDCNAHTVYVPFYGIAYEAGYLAKYMDGVEKVGIIKANDTVETLAEAEQAFADAFADDKNIIVKTLATGYGGFNIADSLYRNAYNVDDSVDMVFPLCGGSTQGLLRYNREHANSFYTIGVDVDMSIYSSRVPFSCVKHMNRVMETCIGQWLSSSGLPHHQDLGLEEGYTELIISKGFENLSEYKEKIEKTAIAKENEYDTAQ